jgi:hypothetical protein
MSISRLLRRTIMSKVNRDVEVKTLEAALVASKAQFLLLTAEYKADGKRWCGDCERFQPLFDNVFGEKLADVHIIDIPRPRWKEDPGANHPYRPHFGASGIPCLLKIDTADNNVVVTSKLIEAECMDETALQTLLAEPTSSTL